MPVTPDEINKLKQTGTLLTIGNVLLWPFYYADKKLGVAASVIATLAAVGLLHHIGKKEQARANSNTFFTQKTEDPMQEGFDNILAGGAKVSELLISGNSPQ